jgi:hypothetical protein
MRRFLTETICGDVAYGRRTHVAGAAYRCTRGKMIMRNAIVSFLVIASTATTFALAQDGGAHGPPKASIIVTQPAASAPTVLLSKAFQPATGLASMVK